MWPSSLVQSAVLTLLLITAFLVVLRKIIRQYHQKRNEELMPLKPKGWYNQRDVYGANSVKTRKLMRLFNGFTLVIWLTIILLTVLLWLINFTK